jgi:hypothetical protein
MIKFFRKIRQQLLTENSSKMVEGGLRGSPRAATSSINFIKFTNVNLCLILLILTTPFDAIFE